MLLDCGVPLVLISLGPAGAFYATRKFSGQASAFEVDEIVDAIGVGDASLAAPSCTSPASPSKSGWARAP